MNGLYLIADTLDLPLRSHGASMIGEGLKQVALGPWDAELEVFAESDILNPLTASVFICFTKNLWAYLTASEDGTSLYLLDGGKAGLGRPKLPVFVGMSVTTTLTGLRKLGAVKAQFNFVDKVWTRVDADNLE